MTSPASEALLQYAAMGTSPGRMGNDIPGMAPHNVYAAEGDDEWVAIACRTDDEWARLAQEIGGGALDPRYTTYEGRQANRDAVEALVGDWTRTRGKYDTQHRLQDLGIPCAAVQQPEERIDRDPNTSAWGMCRTSATPCRTHRSSAPSSSAGC